MSYSSHLFVCQCVYITPFSGLIYGRTHSVDPREGEGFCLARAKVTAGNVYAIITYKFPVLSAKAVPDLQNFIKQHITN